LNLEEEIPALLKGSWALQRDAQGARKPSDADFLGRLSTEGAAN
jgi:hypothetical protein